MPLQTVEGPLITGTGSGFTVTVFVDGTAGEQPFASVYVTVREWVPGLDHVTLTVLVPEPLVTVPVPGGAIAQR